MLYNKYYSDTDQIQEKLMNANTKLDDREKALLNAEAEVAILNRRIQSLEEELEKTEDRFANKFTVAAQIERRRSIKILGF